MQPLRTLVFMIVVSAGLCATLANAAHSATIQTKRGAIEGRVIVRMFDEIVITVFTPKKQIYQFSAKDIDSITASAKTLVGVNTILRTEPSDHGEEIIGLTRGMELAIVETQPDSSWIKVKAWKNVEGWMNKDLLSDQVIFTPEEKRLSIDILQKASETIQAASSAIRGASEPHGSAK